MARVTIEKALENIPNHFQLVKTAIKRVEQLEEGGPPLVEKRSETENNMIIALREIEEKKINVNILEETI